MLKFRLLTFLPFLLFVCSNLSAQSSTRIGDWKQYLPYHTSYYVTQSASHLYFTAEFSLLKLDKTDLSETYLTKVEGLSDVDVALAKYNPYADQLLVAYSNSNVDLVTENDVINFSEIFKNTAILGDKRINTIYFENDSWAYLACGFGLVQLNIKNEEFGFTTFTDTKVFDVAVFQDSIYMTTENGIYRISRSHANPAYFANWTKIGAESGLPDEYSANSLCQFGASLTAAIDGNLYKKQNGGNFELVAQKSGYQVQYISAEGPHLLVGWKCNGDCNGSLQVWDQSTMLNEFNNDCIRRPIYGVEDQSGRIWFADEFFPFKYIDYPSGECHSKDFNTPFSHFATDMVVDPVNNDLYIASGGIQSNGIYQFRSDGFFRYSNGQWTNFNHYFTPELADPIFYDYNALAIDPKTNHLFIGTYWGGVLEYDHSHFTVYNKDNSSLQGAVGDAQRERVSGLAFDSKGNLWVSNFAAPRPISVRKSDGSWQSFKPVTQTNLFQVVVDQQDNKWFIVQGNSGGVMVFNEGADFNSTADDKVRFINTGNSVLTSNTINCLAVDLDGAVWVGTDAGPFVFECGSNVFDSSCKGSQRRVVEGGIPALLLDGEDIRTIAVDGGNRKWFGSTTGVYVQSASGEQQIHKFTTDNSPLFDNTIQKIGINNKNGEVFIATDKGMVSYKGEATEGGIFHIDANILVYPNPVKPDYDGPIAIKGLASNSNVKITDITGRLVFETKAVGGQAIWYGSDLSGKRAASGVYLVFSTAELLIDKPDAAIAKILFIN